MAHCRLWSDLFMSIGVRNGRAQLQVSYIAPIWEIPLKHQAVKSPAQSVPDRLAVASTKFHDGRWKGPSATNASPSAASPDD